MFRSCGKSSVGDARRRESDEEGEQSVVQILPRFGVKDEQEEMQCREGDQQSCEQEDGKLLKNLLDEMRDKIKEYPDPREAMAASFSCRGAIKTGDSLTLEEMNALVNELFRCEFPYSCPHGRPTIINLSLDELDKRFRRT